MTMPPLTKATIKKLLPFNRKETYTIQKLLDNKQLEQFEYISPVETSNNQDLIQKNLIASWLLLKQQDLPTLNFDQVSFRTFSQNNEDGILLYIFTMIGTTNRLFVEIGANCGDSPIGIPENCSTNLVVYHNWNGLILDGGTDNINGLIHFFARCKETKHHHWTDRKSRQADESIYFRPQCKQSFISPDSINATLTSNNLHGEIDLFILDIDGMDYHVWQALDVISPRVVMIEFNQHIDFSAIAIPPLIADFQVDTNIPGIWEVNGTSLGALIDLGKKKGYRLVGLSSGGFNAIFIRNDVGTDIFKEVTIDEIRKNPLYHWTKDSDYISLKQYQEFWDNYNQCHTDR